MLQPKKPVKKPAKPEKKREEKKPRVKDENDERKWKGKKEETPQTEYRLKDLKNRNSNLFKEVPLFRSSFRQGYTEALACLGGISILLYAPPPPIPEMRKSKIQGTPMSRRAF